MSTEERIRTGKRYPPALLEGVNTPWTERYELDEPVFRKHTERLLDLGFTHLYVMSTAGEDSGPRNASPRSYPWRLSVR